MGCFMIPCFGTSKRRKLKKTTTSADQRQEKCGTVLLTKPTEETTNLDLVEPISDSRENDQDQFNSYNRKKVTFDLNVETCEEVSIQEIINHPMESEEEEEREKEVKEESGTLELAATCSLEIENEKERAKEVKQDEFEDEGLHDDNDDDHILIQEESSESLFSLSIESRKKSNTIEVDDKEVNSPLRIPSQYIDSVLNPIENFSQWKALKRGYACTSTNPRLNHQEKENTNLEDEELNAAPFSEEEPTFKKLDHNSKQNTNIIKNFDNDTAVDTSLSSWLLESEKKPHVGKESPSSIGNSYSDGANSWKSFEDRPISGALTVEEVRQLSVCISSSPRRSPRHKIDETPIIGTVGSYWNHTGQATDSSNSGSFCKGMSGGSRKFIEDKKTSCHSTPLGTRLERALDRGTA